MNAINYYYHEIDKIPLLSVEEERALVEKAYNGDKKAQNKLVESNLKFVIKVAGKYSKCGMDFEDLINEGNMGLMHAAEKFNPSNKNRFTTYAVFWIREYIQKAIRETSTGVRFPSNRYRDMMDPKWQFANLDKVTTGPDDEKTTLANIIRDDRVLTPEEDCYQNQLKQDLWELVGDLSEKEQQVIIRRYGLDGKKPQSLGEVGTALNLSKERIRQIERGVISNLRQNFSAEWFGEDLAA